MITVDEIMTTEIFTLPATATVADAIRVMAGCSIRHIPIVDREGNLEGLVTRHDVVNVMDSTLRATASRRDPATITLQEIMTRDVVTVEGGARGKGEMVEAGENVVGAADQFSDAVGLAEACEGLDVGAGDETPRFTRLHHEALGVGLGDGDEGLIELGQGPLAEDIGGIVLDVEGQPDDALLVRVVRPDHGRPVVLVWVQGQGRRPDAGGDLGGADLGQGRHRP